MRKVCTYRGRPGVRYLVRCSCLRWGLRGSLPRHPPTHPRRTLGVRHQCTFGLNRTDPRPRVSGAHSHPRPKDGDYGSTGDVHPRSLLPPSVGAPRSEGTVDTGPVLAEGNRNRNPDGSRLSLVTHRTCGQHPRADESEVEHSKDYLANFLKPSQWFVVVDVKSFNLTSTVNIVTLSVLSVSRSPTWVLQETSSVHDRSRGRKDDSGNEERRYTGLRRGGGAGRSPEWCRRLHAARPQSFSFHLYQTRTTRVSVLGCDSVFDEILSCVNYKRIKGPLKRTGEWNESKK